MTCTDAINAVKDTHLSKEYAISKIMDCKASDEYKPHPLINKIRKRNPKPSLRFGYVDL